MSTGKDNNILLVANWESNVGYAWWLMENFWITIAEHFKKSGAASYLVYPKITQLPESIANSSISASELDLNDRSLSNILKLKNFIHDNDINAIYFSDYPSYSFFYPLLRLFGIKKIVVHDHTPGERTTANGLTRIIKILRQSTPFITADFNIAVTEFVHQRHLDVNCIPANKCSVASNGIRPISLLNADRQYAYEQFNIPNDRKIIITTGRASYYKGIDFFIRCADELINKQGLKQLHFLFCGDGPDMDDFIALRDQLHLTDNFTFAGKRADITKILPSCEVGLHCATGEVGYSLSILEYMSAGLVTIVPDNPSTSLATEHLTNGLLYKSRDLPSAADAILKALDNEVAVKIKPHAINSINERYNIENTNIQLIEILDTVFT